MSKIEVSYVNHMGDDNSVADAARISMDKTADKFTTEQNHSLIKFLASGLTSKERDEILQQITHGTNDFVSSQELFYRLRTMAVHWTPFAHSAISVRVKAPIPIRTQCFKHKQGLVENEESRRYISSTPEIFIPEFRSKPEGSIKQGSAGLHPQNADMQNLYEKTVENAISTYESLLAYGVAPEQARMVLPQGAMVNWVWTGNLMAFANFYNKRTDDHAQKEVAAVAYAIEDVILPLFPVSWDALTS